MKAQAGHAGAQAVHKQRFDSVDCLRGMAVFAMLGANLAGPILLQPHPLWWRLYASTAAPIFVFLAGMMVAYAVQKGKETGHPSPIWGYLRRGVELVFITACLDAFVFQICPFMAFDVLNIIGLSLPLTYLLLKLPVWLRWVLTLLIFGITPLLQQYFGYHLAITDVSWVEATWTQVMQAYQKVSLHQWLVDGWFPVFPWLGVSFLGALCYPLYQKKLAWGSLMILFLVGVIVWRSYPGAYVIREGYSELFYPPTIGFFMTMAGVVLTLLKGLDGVFEVGATLLAHPILKGLQTLLFAFGKASLTAYVGHLVLIQFVFYPWLHKVNGWVFFGAYMLLIAIVFGWIKLFMWLKSLKQKQNQLES